MIKMVALYRTPADAELFDRHYFDLHLPLVRAIPGLRKLEVIRVTGAPMGDARFHLMAEMSYDSIDAMNAANATPEGRAAARDLMGFASDVVTLFYGEVQA